MKISVILDATIRITSIIVMFAAGVASIPFLFYGLGLFFGAEHNQTTETAFSSIVEGVILILLPFAIAKILIARENFVFSILAVMPTLTGVITVALWGTYWTGWQHTKDNDFVYYLVGEIEIDPIVSFLKWSVIVLVAFLVMGFLAAITQAPLRRGNP